MSPSKLLEAAGFYKSNDDLYYYQKQWYKLVDYQKYGKTRVSNKIVMTLEGVEEPTLLQVTIRPYNRVIIVENFRPFLSDDEVWEYLEGMFANLLDEETKIILKRCGRGFCGEKIVDDVKITAVDTPQPTIGAVLWRLAEGGEHNGEKIETKG